MAGFQITKGKEIIDSADRWFELAPPLGRRKHWEDGRSAKELAKAWFPASSPTPKIPPELERLFQSSPEFQPLRLKCGIPEHDVPLDTFRGGKRSQDLRLLGQAERSRVVISVEAKADEPFNETLEAWLRGMANNLKSKIPARANLLLEGLIGETIAAHPEHLKLRQQLLTGTAGALIEARREGADVAVFVVHEFVDKDCTTAENLDRNHRDFERFVRLLLQAPEILIGNETLFGPIDVPGGEFIPARIPLYVGKIRRLLDIQTDNGCCNSRCNYTDSVL